MQAGKYSYKACFEQAQRKASNSSGIKNEAARQKVFREKAYDAWSTSTHWNKMISESETPRPVTMKESVKGGSFVQ
jgi:hypothetical protein